VKNAAAAPIAATLRERLRAANLSMVGSSTWAATLVRAYETAYFDKVTLTGTFASIFAADGCSHRVRHHQGETTCAAPGAPSPLDVRIAC
jgi:hypothetical protein